MLRVLAVLACAVAVGRCGEEGRSPHALLVDELVAARPGARYSDNIIEDAKLDVPGLVRKYGYPLEEHTVLTADGYLLRAHRIPRGRGQLPSLTRRPVVLVMHGLMCSSADFLVLGPGNALGYLLADAGYDVWLGNARGNHYSRRHVLLDPDDKEEQGFWKFSWDEIGRRDLPALVEHIASRTGQRRLHYVGYSQGATAFLVLNSLRPEYNERFLSFQALAPAAYAEHNENELRKILVQFESVLEAVAFRLGFGEVLGPSARELTAALALRFCGDESFLQPLCAAAILGTGSVENFNATMLPLFLGHNPAGGAVRQIIHYAQVMRFERFARFNFNPLVNLALYGSSVPPEYDVARVTAPAHVHYSRGDAQADERDVRLLAARLGSAAGLHRVPRASFGHFDFIWGGDARDQLYDGLIRIMKEIDESS